ncbi:MAG: SDR family NAD(P)-dependent oxidoreductase [Bacillota bacterium]
MKALVTGATSGLGRAMAIYLSLMGYDLILASRSTEAMEQLQKKLPTEVQIVTVDLSIPSHCYTLYEQTKDEDIDILINNAGFGYHGNFLSNPLEDDLNMLDLNVRCVHILTKLYLTDFHKKNKGSIMNVASIAGFMPGPLMATYYATKSYVLRLSESIAEELKQEGSAVHICVLCPGPVETNFNKRAGMVLGFPHQPTAKMIAKTALIEMFQKKNTVILPNMAMKFAHFGMKFFSESQLSKISYQLQNLKE